MGISSSKAFFNRSIHKDDPEYTEWFRRGTEDIVIRSVAEANEFRKTAEWKQLRKEFISNSDKICAACGLNMSHYVGKEQTKIHADHIKPLRVFWSKRLDRDNLQILCGECNRHKNNNYGPKATEEAGKQTLEARRRAIVLADFAKEDEVRHALKIGRYEAIADEFYKKRRKCSLDQFLWSKVCEIAHKRLPYLKAMSEDEFRATIVAIKSPDFRFPNE